MTKLHVSHLKALPRAEKHRTYVLEFVCFMQNYKQELTPPSVGWTHSKVAGVCITISLHCALSLRRLLRSDLMMSSKMLQTKV